MIKDDKIVKNQDGGLKVLLFDLKRSNVMFSCEISFVPSYQLIVPSTYIMAPATHIPTDKATKIHTLTPLTYELFFFKIVE